MNRHELDVPSLVFGLLFSVLGIAILVDSLESYTVRLAYVIPIAIIGIGVLLTGAAVARDRREPAGEEERGDARRDEATGVEPGGPATR